jgi:ABC-type oligopeptide transport system substrate-binding subunit
MLVNGGSNRGGYASEEFDALADAYQAAQSEEEAFDLMWQMEEVLQRDKPYILLFDTGILEFYRTESIEYPFSETLGGIQFIQGMQELVTAAK